MSNFLGSTLLSVFISTSLFATQAQATVLQNTTGLSGTFTTETFNTNAGDSTPAGSQFTGLTFGPENFVSDLFDGVFSNMTGSVIANFTKLGCGEPGNCITPTFINFSSIMSDVAFAFVSNPGTSTFSAYLGANPVESFIANTDFSGDFYGFTGIAFDSIRIDSGGSDSSYALDNLQSRTANSVPEPASLALLGLGFIGLVASRRNKRASVCPEGIRVVELA